MQLFLHLFFYWHLLGCNAPISPEGGSNVLQCHLIIIKEEEHAKHQCGPHWMLLYRKQKHGKLKVTTTVKKVWNNWKIKMKFLKCHLVKLALACHVPVTATHCYGCKKGLVDEGSVFYQNKGRQTKTHKYKHKLVKVGHTLLSTTFTLKLC